MSDAMETSRIHCGLQDRSWVLSRIQGKYRAVPLVEVKGDLGKVI